MYVIRFGCGWFRMQVDVSPIRVLVSIKQFVKLAVIIFLEYPVNIVIKNCQNSVIVAPKGILADGRLQSFAEGLHSGAVSCQHVRTSRRVRVSAWLPHVSTNQHRRLQRPGAPRRDRAVPRGRRSSRPPADPVVT